MQVKKISEAQKIAMFRHIYLLNRVMAKENIFKKDYFLVI